MCTRHVRSSASSVSPKFADVSSAHLSAILSAAFSPFAVLRSPISASAILNTLQEYGKRVNNFFSFSQARGESASSSVFFPASIFPRTVSPFRKRNTAGKKNSQFEISGTLIVNDAIASRIVFSCCVR